MTNTNTLRLNIPDQIDGFKYFCQLDEQWRDEPYTITQDPDQTIGLSGCVPSLQAVVLANTCEAPVDPRTQADWNLAHGFRTANTGTKHASWDLLVTTHELRQDIILPDINALRSALEVGGFVVASLKTPDRTGLGTPSGHVVGIHMVEVDGARVIDTKSPDKSQLRWSLASILPFVSADLRHIYAA